MMGDKVEKIFVIPKYQDQALNTLKNTGIQRSAVVTAGIELVLKFLDKGMSMDEIEVSVFESKPSSHLEKVQKEREKKKHDLIVT